MEFTCNKHSADCPSLTNFHCNSHHRGTVLGVLSFIAMRWLSSPSLNYLSDSPGRPTVEALGLSFLTLTSHLLQLGCDARVGGERGGFILDSSLAKSIHIFLSFPKSALFFPPKLQAYLRLWSFLKAFSALEFPPQEHLPPTHATTLHSHPSSLHLSSFLFAWRTGVALLCVPSPF